MTVPKDPKITIDGKSSLVSHLEKLNPSLLEFNDLSKPASYLKKKSLCVKKASLKGIIFRGEFIDVEFKTCKFVNCEFNGVYAFFLIFTSCRFENCSFRYSKFTHIEWFWDRLEFVNTTFQHVEWKEGSICNSILSDCYIQGLTISDFSTENVFFKNSQIETSSFLYLNNTHEKESINEKPDFYDLEFEECFIADTFFNSIDFRTSRIFNTVIYKSSFLDCKLSEKTIVSNKNLDYRCYIAGDFQTLLNSDTLPNDVYSTYFNITKGKQTKGILKNFTTKLSLQSVFISYSFKDKLFANRLNEALRQNNVETFLWEKDAPAGEPLTNIMESNIMKHQRIIFIASENSIKSKACQFELSQGRIKQEANWTNIFFPICIDQFLFDVKKSDIRPITKAEEYWENIQELRRVNVLDYSKFSNAEMDEELFNKNVLEILEGLSISHK